MDLELIKQQYPEIPVGSRAKDLTNQRFNNWKVLYRTTNKGEKVCWVCQCQCNNKTIKVVKAGSLTNSTSKDCGCGRKQAVSKQNDKKIHIRDDNGNIILKRCFRCQEWFPLNNFWKNSAQKDGYAGECKECASYAKENRYNQYKKSATRRQLEFNLSKEEFYNLTQQKCFYCGEFNKYNGIDRINSKIGYISTNCVPCCTICNRMKLDYELNDWLQHMSKILKYMEERYE